MFLLNHTADEVTLDAGAAPAVNVLDPDIPANGQLRLPPYGVAVLREGGN